jgi:hypothetical protein
MKIVITEEQKKKLFTPRNIDERKEQLKKYLSEKTKNLLSRLNITEIMVHARIDDYDEIITPMDHLEGGYDKLIIDGKNYNGFPKMVGDDENMVINWEDTLTTFLNSIIPQPSDESIYKAEPNVVGRMFRVDITPSKINIIFSYSIVEYKDKEGKETINL